MENINDLIKDKIIEEYYIHSAKEILKLSDSSRFWYHFIPVYLFDINQTKYRLLRRTSFREIKRNSK